MSLEYRGAHDLTPADPTDPPKPPKVHKKPASKTLKKAKPHAGFTFKEFCERVQVGGVIDWYNASSHFAKAFWLLAIAVFFTILVLEIVQTVRQYFTNPIKTTISIMPAAELEIPPLYICPLNHIDYKKVQNENLTDDLAAVMPYVVKPQGMEGIFAEVLAYWLKIAGPLLKDAMDSFFHSVPMTASELKEKMAKISYSKRQIIPHCEFEGFRFDCTDNITLVVDKDYGLCYRLDTGRRQTIPGYGLRIFIDLHSDATSQGNLNSLLFQGAVLRFGEDAHPLGLGGHFSAPGEYARYGLEQLLEKFTPVTTSETPQICSDPGDVEFEFLNVPYSKLACGIDRTVQGGFPACGCIPTFDSEYLKPEYRDTPLCNVTTLMNCYLRHFKEIKDEEESWKGDHKGCYRKCTSTRYRIAESSMRLGSAQLDHIFDLILKTGDNLAGHVDRFFGKGKSGKGKVRLGPFNTSRSLPELGNLTDTFGVTPSIHGRGLSDIGGKETIKDAGIPGIPSELDGSAPPGFPEVPPLELTPPKDGSVPPIADPRYWKRSLILLEVAFEKMEYMSIVQSPAKTRTELIADIGGQVGLWMGASMFSVLQLFALCTAWGYTRFHAKRKARKVQG